MLALVMLVACRGEQSKQQRADDEPSKRLKPPTPPPAPPPAAPVKPRASAGEAIEYTLRFDDAPTHYADVTAVVPSPGDTVELMMPVWTPGSYKVRDYSRNVSSLTAATAAGEPLKVDKTRKNRWKVQTGGADHVVLRYRTYGNEISVRTNFIAAEMAVLNGAATFLTLAEGHERPHDVLIEPRAGWEAVVTSLPPHPAGGEHRFLAPDYDTLVDSPIVAGSPTITEFVVAKIPHVLATFGPLQLWDQQQAASDLAKVTAEHIDFWRVTPHERYWFLNTLIGKFNGLEHKRSTLLNAPPLVMGTRKEYLDWLALASHEYFHTWNIKRLRPAGLGPFDYENEVYVRSLWIVEGITAYYDELLLARAGLLSEAEYLERLGKHVKELQKAPGRLTQSLSEASYDAWIKYYQKDENFVNTGISYYTKGSLVALLLDVEIRRASSGARSLDDVMRAAYERFSGESGYTPAEFRALASEVAGTELEGFFAQAVDGTSELDYAPALEWLGLRFAPASEEDPEAEPAGWLGAKVKSSALQWIVEEVPQGTPAYAAGVSAGDEIIAIDGLRVPAESRDSEGTALDERLERYRPGAEIELLVARRGVITRLAVTLGSTPEEEFVLEADPKASAAAVKRRRDWL